MGTHPPERPPGGEQLWADSEWWREVVRRGGDPLTDPLPGPEDGVAQETAPAQEPVAPGDEPPAGPPVEPPSEPTATPPESAAAPLARPLRVPRVTDDPDGDGPVQPESHQPTRQQRTPQPQRPTRQPSASPPPAHRVQPRRERRSVRAVVGPRVADAALLLLALAVVALVYLSLTR